MTRRELLKSLFMAAGYALVPNLPSDEILNKIPTIEFDNFVAYAKMSFNLYVINPRALGIIESGINIGEIDGK